jgi:hypothetical protein
VRPERHAGAGLVSEGQEAAQDLELSPLRLGVEYVGQDLEELAGGEAEGGARHAARPSAALSLDHGQYQVSIASAFGLNARSPPALLRAGLTVAF